MIVYISRLMRRIRQAGIWSLRRSLMTLMLLMLLMSFSSVILGVGMLIKFVMLLLGVFLVVVGVLLVFLLVTFVIIALFQNSINPGGFIFIFFGFSRPYLLMIVMLIPILFCLLPIVVRLMAGLKRLLASLPRSLSAMVTMHLLAEAGNGQLTRLRNVIYPAKSTMLLRCTCLSISINHVRRLYVTRKPDYPRDWE